MGLSRVRIEYNWKEQPNCSLNMQRIEQLAKSSKNTMPAIAIRVECHHILRKPSMAIEYEISFMQNNQHKQEMCKNYALFHYGKRNRRN